MNQLHKLAGTAGHFEDAAFGEAVLTMEEALRSASEDEFSTILSDKAWLLKIAE